MHHPTDRIAHTTTFVIPVVEHLLEREIAQWVIFSKYSTKQIKVRETNMLLIIIEMTALILVKLLFQLR